MANLSEDIQCAGSDTRPPMLDRTDFASWQQRIRLYCRGKENGVNILKSIDEGPFQMGTFRETLAEGNEGALHLGPERPRVYSDLSPEDKERYNADIRATNILLQGLPKDIYSLINHYTDAKDIWDNVKMLLEDCTNTGLNEGNKRVKSILLLAIPDEYLLKFHNVADAKSLWEAIKSRFGGNIESKKMQKNVLKHQFENFSTASNESLDKAYDRFQKLISQLEVHGAPISKEDINQKFLRSLPSSWNQIALIMRNKPDIDEIDIDDLYNNLRVYEDELKRSSGSNSASQNLAFLSSENTGSTNEVSTASRDFGLTPSLTQPTTKSKLENEIFTMDEDDLEELDLRWHVAMLTVKVKKFIQRIGRNMDFKEKRHVSLDNNDFEVEPVNYALMAISSSSSSSSSDSEVQQCSKCLESFKCLQKNYDTEREKHNKAKLEALESLESRIIRHEKNELAWGEKYELQNYELKCREIKINNLNLELEKVVKYNRDEIKDKMIIDEE
ncbi:hypothetical protein Tco_1293911 [Tanacetum coccineum]